MSLTATEVLNFFEKARRHGNTTIKNTCDCCGRGGCGVYATAYRESQLMRNRPDPGNICASCAAINENIVGRIISDAKLGEAEPPRKRRH